MLEHRWCIRGMKLASFPLELAKPLVRTVYTRDAYAPLLRRGINWASAGYTPRPQTEPPPKAIPERREVTSIVEHPFDQGLFWTGYLSHVLRRCQAAFFSVPRLDKSII
jgi:hypothetical protein